ncbi:MAG TPA: hypothetical protein EYH46_02715 [Sulfurivirga caldicuralii]|nr:hypothetical protein [Sulfurivirga caldicuralii]
MLKEWVQYWTTPVRHPAARKMGYLYESIALQARYQRCRAQWQSHYALCRQAITEAVADCQRGRVLILGAGLLDDIPLAHLSDRFDEVCLLDLVWLRAARRAAKPFANVSCIEHDVTESLLPLLQGKRTVATPTWGLDQGFSMVVSLNLVTQLPLLPARWLLRQQAAAVEIEHYAQELMRAHLAYLRQFDQAHICLIADRCIQKRDATGRQVDGIDPWWGLTPPPAQQAWWWEAVPLKEGGGYRRRHQVGVSFWRNG